MEPIYAHGFHVWTGTHVQLVIVFDYRDREGKYYEVVSKGGRDLAEELGMLMHNMQQFLDEEIIKVNDVRVRPRVIDVAVGIKGYVHRPYIEYVVAFEAPLRKGDNRYEVHYEEEVAEYDYEIVHIFPLNTSIVGWEMAGSGEASSNVLRVRVKRGTRVGGRETIQFRVP